MYFSDYKAVNIEYGKLSGKQREYKEIKIV